MHRYKTLFPFLILLLIFFGCASTKTKQVEKTPPFQFVGTTLSKGVDTTGNVGIPLEATDTFNTEDNEAVALCKFENLSGEHTVRWEWYEPSGNLYYATKNFPIEASRGRFLREATAWHRLSIQGDRAATQPGNWEVWIFLDNERIDGRTFIIKGLPDISPPVVSQKPYLKDWGLIIGIEDYAYLPKVDYARKDALIIKDYFIKVFGVPEENIISLIDSDATKARIEGYLREYLPSNIGKDTTLYVYFAGHGAPDMKKGEAYLVPHDGDTKFIEQTGYRLMTFYQDLDKLGTQRVYVFLDSCFSGVATRAAEMLTKGARPALVHVKETDLRSNTLISLSAASSGQISNIYPETKHGLFTYFLLRALKGEADMDDDNWISISEIYEYVKRNVTRVSRRLGTDQTPAINPSLEQIKDIAVLRVLR